MPQKEHRFRSNEGLMDCGKSGVNYKIAGCENGGDLYILIGGELGVDLVMFKIKWSTP